VQGAVRLRITLLANGTVGSITPVTRLPHGLTERAIAAARGIRFKPKMVNGVPQSVVITRDYTFTIY
jgi:TonB family protein